MRREQRHNNNVNKERKKKVNIQTNRSLVDPVDDPASTTKGKGGRPARWSLGSRQTHHLSFVSFVCVCLYVIFCLFVCEPACVFVIRVCLCL